MFLVSRRPDPFCHEFQNADRGLDRPEIPKPAPRLSRADNSPDSVTMPQTIDASGPDVAFSTAYA